MVQPLSKGIWQYLAKLQMHLTFEQSILLVRIYTKETLAKYEGLYA